MKVRLNIAQYPLLQCDLSEPAMFKLLRPTVKEQLHLQENTVFYLDLGVKVTKDIVQYPLHHVTYAVV